MKVFALFILAATVVLGADKRDVAELVSGAEFLAKASVADRVEIDTPQSASAHMQVALSKTKEIEELLATFRFSDVPLRGQKILVNGEEAWVVTPCQCLGDYRLRFFRSDTQIIAVTFHHQQFVRVEGTKGGPEFDLVPESGAEIRKHVETLLKERANQPPPRNAGGSPSAGDSPASETPSSPGPRG